MSKRVIIGETFPDWVTNQVNARQTFLKLNNKNDSTLKYTYNRAPYLGLYSSVDISGSFYGYSGADLALNYPLFGGTKITEIPTDVFTNSGSSFSRAQLGGVSYSNTYTAYGYLATTDSGYVPPPGITSAEIKSLNRGSLREATVNITCHNLKQFSFIEALYLRLKYTMLLEWGHSNWIDNNGNFSTLSPSIVTANFLNGDSSWNILRLIEITRRHTCGNYDGFLGQVKNFDWTLRNDGGYDIVLKLLSLGDVIESLKINVNYPGLNSAAPEFYETPSGNSSPYFYPTYIKNKDKSTLNQILYAITRYLDNSTQIDGNIKYLNGYENLTYSSLVGATYSYSWYDLKSSFTLDEEDTTTTDSDYLVSREAISVPFEGLSIDTDGTPTDGNLYYIKLGTLLRIIETFLLKYDSEHSSTNYGDTERSGSGVGDGGGQPLIGIDFNYNSNFCLTIEDQFSFDPRICLLKPHRYIPTDANGIFTYIDDNFRVKDNSFLGKFMHIYVNVEYISSTLDKNIDSEGKVSLYDFLTSLMKGIQRTTGCINDFEVTYDDVTNYLVIRDNNPLPNAVKTFKPEKSRTVTRFNTHLLTNTEGSFVTDASLRTELTNTYASALAIGAQANGNRIGENSTTFSKLNEGYIDLVQQSKSSLDDDIISTQLASGSKADEICEGTLNDVFIILDGIHQGVITPDQIQNGSQEIVDFFKLKLGELTQKKQIPGAGLIPLNLKLTMDGLSGMRIYEVYTTDDQVLPPTYNDKFHFITKGITHKIDTKGWYTTLESIGGPRDTSLNYIQDPYAGRKNTFNRNSPGVGVIASGSDGEVKCWIRSDGQKECCTYKAFTTTSGYNYNKWVHTGLEESFYTRTVKSITLHYTDGNRDGDAQGTINFVGKCNFGATRTQEGRPAYARGGMHFAISGDGSIAKGIPDNVYCVQGNDWNTNGVGIEVKGKGNLRKSDYDALPAVDRVDLGYVYNGSQYYEEFTDNQIRALKFVMESIINKYPIIKQGITGKSVWRVFGIPKPVPGGNYTSIKNRGRHDVPGVWSHSTARTSTHFDTYPSPKLVTMLLSLGYKDIPNDVNTNFVN